MPTPSAVIGSTSLAVSTMPSSPLPTSANRLALHRLTDSTAQASHFSGEVSRSGRKGAVTNRDEVATRLATVLAPQLESAADELLVEKLEALVEVLAVSKEVMTSEEAREFLGYSEDQWKKKACTYPRVPDGRGFLYRRESLMRILCARERFAVAERRDPSDDSGEGQLTDVPAGGGVYFVQAATGGAIKIGVAANVKKRLGALSTMSPLPLRALYVLRDADAAIEKRLHAALDRHRSHGEWFHNVPPVLRMLDLAMQNAGEDEPTRSRILGIAHRGSAP